MKPTVQLKPEDVPFVCNAILLYATVMCANLKATSLPTAPKEAPSTVTLKAVTKKRKRGRPPKNAVTPKPVAEAA